MKAVRLFAPARTEFTTEKILHSWAALSAAQLCRTSMGPVGQEINHSYPLFCTGYFMHDRLPFKSSRPITGSHGTAHWCNYMIALVKYSFVNMGQLLAGRSVQMRAFHTFQNLLFQTLEQGGMIAIICVLNNLCKCCIENVVQKLLPGSFLLLGIKGRAEMSSMGPPSNTVNAKGKSSEFCIQNNY